MVRVTLRIMHHHHHQKRDRTLTAPGDLDHFISTADMTIQRDCPLSDKHEHATLPLMTVLVIVAINLNSDQFRTGKKKP